MIESQVVKCIQQLNSIEVKCITSRVIGIEQKQDKLLIARTHILGLHHKEREKGNRRYTYNCKEI